MEKKNSLLRVRSLSVLWALLAILLCAAPCGAVTVESGETLNVGTGKDVERIENAFLVVRGTANLYPGAYVDYGIYALEGSTVNIYAVEIGSGYFVSVSNGEQDAVVKVHGTDFEVTNGTIDPSGSSFTLAPPYLGYLKWAYENLSYEVKFFSDIPIYLVPPETSVKQLDIDIKPGGNPNTINLNSKGVVPVAVLTTDSFDASIVDPATVEFAGAAPVRWALKDVDEDGDNDLLLHFKKQDLNLDENSTEATLTGETTDGNTIEGTDEVRIIQPKGRRNGFFQRRWRGKLR